MESILFTIKNVEFYIMFGAVLAAAGGLMITAMSDFLQNKVGKRHVRTPKAAPEPIEGRVTIKL